MKEGDIIFRWVDSAKEDVPVRGPYFTDQAAIIGYAYYHALSDLLRIGLSPGIQTALKNAQAGDTIKILNMYRGGDLLVKRLDTKDIKLLLDAISLKNRVECVNIEIEKNIPDDLIVEKKELDKQIKKIKNQLKQQGLAI